MKSLLSQKKECYICGLPTVHKHHIFYGSANRRISEEQGCWVYLCPAHHNMSNRSVHFDKSLDNWLKETCQLAWESEIGSREEFMRLFGKNYVREGNDEE